MEKTETLKQEEAISTIDIVHFGRNDNYHVDYLERTNACINYNLRSIQRAGLRGKVRLLFVDWASDQPLSEVILVKPELADGIVFLYLDQDFLERSQLKVEDKNLSFACNLGLYRSKADYLFWGASDLIATPRDFRNLYRATQELSSHEGTKLLMAERAFLSRYFFTRSRGFEDVDYYLKNFYFESERISGVGGGGALIGAKRTLLIKLGGLNEAIKGSWGGHDPELFIRATKYDSFVNMSKRYGIYFHKFPYADIGARKRVVSRHSMDWINHIDNINDNRSDLASFENISLANASVLTAVSAFPTIYIENISLSTWQFYKTVSSSLRLYKELYQLTSVKQILEANMPDAIVLNGAFNDQFFRAACFVCRTAVLVWRYPDGNGGHVIAALSTSRDFLREAGIHDYFRGNLLAIYEKHKFYINSETLDFLNGRQVIVFTRVDNQVYFNIMDGKLIESLQTDLHFPNNESRNVKATRDPVIFLVFFLFIFIRASKWVFNKFRELISQ